MTTLRLSKSSALIAGLLVLAPICARAADHTVAAGGTLPTATTLTAGDTITLQGDASVGTAQYAMAARYSSIVSSDNNVWRTLTVNSANSRLMQINNGTFTVTFDHIILSSATITTAGQMGGGILFSNGGAGTATINGDFQVNNNWAAGNGGGIQVGTNLLVFGGKVSFTGNYAGAQGGGVNIGVGSPGVTFMDTVVFTSNTAAQNGGATHIHNGSGTITFQGSSTFALNESGSFGGAVSAFGHLDFQKGAYFENNKSISADGGGGAIYVKGNATIVGSSTFINNSAGGYGGAIFHDLSAATPTALTLDASLGDIWFEGNQSNTATTATRNAISIRTSPTTTPSLIFNTGTGANAHTIALLDPINTTDATAYATITQNGDGIVLLDTFTSAVTATTTINSGAFRLTRRATYGTSDTIGDFILAGPATLSGNGTIRANTITLADNAHLEVIGGGTLALQATTHNYSTNGVRISGNGTIDAGGAITALLVDVGSLVADDPAGGMLANSAQTLTFAASTPLTIANSGTIAIDLFAGNISDQLAVDTLALTGSAYLNLIGAGNGSYKVLTATSDITALTANLNPLVNGLAPAGHFGAVKDYQNSGKELWINFTTQNLATAWTGIGGGIWKNDSGSNLNWYDGNAATPDYAFINGDRVRFDDTATVKTVTIDAAGVTAADITVDNTVGNDYTFVGSGGIVTSTTSSVGSLVTTPTGKLVKVGAGALSFENTGTNIFVGGIEISGGTLGFTAGNQLGDGGNGIHFTDAAALRANADNLTLSNNLLIDAGKTATLDTAAHTLTYSGILTGIAATGTLAKTGSGTLKLTEDNSAINAAAATHISEGTLSLDTAAAKLGGRIDIATGATLAGIGAATGDIFAAAGAIIRPGSTHTAAETLTLRNLTLDSSTVRFDLFEGNVSDQLNITGTLTISGSNTIDISAFKSGTFALGNIAALDVASTKVTIGGVAQVAGSRQTATIAASGTNLLLNASADMSRILRWTGSTSATWSSIGANWTDGAAVTLYANGDRVIFDSTADTASPGNRSITIEGTGVTVSDIQIQGSGNYTFAGSGITADAASVISGTLTGATGKFVKDGSGTLAFTNAANNFKNGIELGGGAVTFTDGAQLNGGGIRFTGDTALAPQADALTLSANIAIDAGKTAALALGANNLALTGTLSATAASGTLVKTGTGTLTLSGNSAATTSNLVANISAGEFRLAGASLGGTVNLAANTRLSGIGSLNMVRTSAGDVIAVGAGILNIASLQLASGGTLTSSSPNATLAGAATFAGSLTADIAAGNALTFTGSNTGAASLLKIGAGNLVFEGAPSFGYTGTTQIDQGFVMFRNISGTDAAAVINTIVLNGGWLDLSDAQALDTTGSTSNDWAGLKIIRGANAASSGVIGVNDIVRVGSGTTTFAIGSGTKTGVFVVIDAGNDTAVLSGTNIYKGYTRIDSGTLRVTADMQLGDIAAKREVVLNGGALQISSSLTTTRAIELRTDGTVVTDAGVATTWAAVNVTGSGLFTFTKLGSGTFTNNGASAAAAVNVTEGRYVATKSNGAGTGYVTVAANAIFEMNTGAGTAVVANNFAGSGTLAITAGANTFSGTSVAIDHIAITGAATNITSANGLLPIAFGTPNGTLTIDAARFNLGAPTTMLGNVTLSNNATFGFASSGTGGASFKTATVNTLAGSGTLWFNTNLARARNDRLAILTTPSGDYTLRINNTGPVPTTYSAPLTIIDAPAGGTATFTLPGGKIDVGMFSYAVTTGTESGKLVVNITGTGAMSNAGSVINAMAGALPLSWFSELNTVSQRLGELHLDKRGPEGRPSAWMRAYGQQLDFGAGVTGLAFDERQYVVDAGVDYKLRSAGETSVYIGGFFGYGQTDRDFGSAGEASGQSIHGGIYETICTKSGWYLDGVLKVNGFDNDFTAVAPTGETMTGNYNTYAIGGSLELGKRFEIDSGWYIEPQIQGAYTQLMGKRYTTSSGIEVQFETGNTAQGRVGFVFGRLFEAGVDKYFQVYVKAYGASQWTTGGAVIATPAGGQPQRFLPAIKGDRLEGGTGFAWKPSAKQFQLYFDLETATADDYVKPWGLNFGVHYGW
ncbi:autotransporter outer membrane beta-barrel domain-containing protein [Termitidicoccus mucosus]|uniref:Autotransporter domain-containing protein n=1 Tax=Termitidicoccus mucosus TaxID=1184151 RepID=A0A178IM89_9BACT|nr:hypothetical protein AW736_05150 [Opitutaceae bacterium TSB47]